MPLLWNPCGPCRHLPSADTSSPYSQDFPEELQSPPSRAYPSGPDPLRTPPPGPDSDPQWPESRDATAMRDAIRIAHPQFAGGAKLRVLFLRAMRKHIRLI